MLLRLCGIRFGSRTNLFLSGKAELDVKTRQDYVGFFEAKDPAPTKPGPRRALSRSSTF